jgi:hypothetical protein
MKVLQRGLGATKEEIQTKLAAMTDEEKKCQECKGKADFVYFIPPGVIGPMVYPICEQCRDILSTVIIGMGQMYRDLPRRLMGDSNDPSP